MKAYIYIFIIMLFLSCSQEEVSPDLTNQCYGVQNLENDESSNLSRLRVVGNQIVDNSCNSIILKGVAIIDPYFIEEIEGGLVESDFKLLSEEWNVNIIRVPVHPDLWESNPNYLEKYVDPIIQWANKYNFYILLGYHAHGNIKSGQSELPDWKNNPPWNGNPYNSDKNLAINALSKMAKRYQNKPWVIYGAFNEPAYISWNDWKPEAENLVDVIHQIDSNALVTISGLDWGYDLSEALNDPVNRKNVVYETHPYPWKGTSWMNVVPKLKQKYPVILGEWGFDQEYYPNANAAAYGKPLINLCKENEIGRIAWIWHHDWYPAIFENKERDLSAFGKIVKDDLMDQ